VVIASIRFAYFTWIVEDERVLCSALGRLDRLLQRLGSGLRTRDSLCRRHLDLPSTNAVRTWMYRATVHYLYTECPQGREQSTCELLGAPTKREQVPLLSEPFTGFEPGPSRGSGTAASRLNSPVP